MVNDSQRNNLILTTVIVVTGIVAIFFMYQFVTQLNKSGEIIIMTANGTFKIVSEGTENITKSFHELVLLKQQEIQTIKDLQKNMSASDRNQTNYIVSSVIGLEQSIDKHNSILEHIISLIEVDQAKNNGTTTTTTVQDDNNTIPLVKNQSYTTNS